MITFLSSILCGLSLFLYGMKLLTDGLHHIAYDRFSPSVRQKRLTPFKGLLWGALITMLLQSSSGTSVILIGLAQAGLLSLLEIAPMIMGANIGSTFTSQLIAFNVGAFAPFILTLGVICLFLKKNQRLYHLGQAFIGFSFIFMGMDFLNQGLAPLHTLVRFQTALLILADRPLLGIILGFCLTAIIQSSSTGIALLQAMALSRSIQLSTAVPILLGLNIGTCVTALIASVPLGIRGKQVAIFHLLFNLIGVVIMLPFMDSLVDFSIYLSPYAITRQIANSHTLFNVATTLLLFPFITHLVRLVTLLSGSKEQPL